MIAIIKGDTPAIAHTGHADKLEYGWWERKRGNILLPRTLGHKNNYVLTHAELCAYDIELVQAAEWITKERNRVANTLGTLRKGRQMLWHEENPTCFTIAHILEGMVTLAKFKLGVMNLLNYVAKERVNEKRLADQTDQSPVGVDPR